MLEEFKVEGHPKIAKVIAITDIKKYTAEDRLIVVVDAKNVDELNEVVEQLGQLFSESGFRGQAIVTFQDIKMKEHIVDPNDVVVHEQKRD